MFPEDVYPTFFINAAHWLVWAVLKQVENQEWLQIKTIKGKKQKGATHEEISTNRIKKKGKTDALLEIESRLRRIKGYRHLPTPRQALKQRLEVTKEAA